MKYTFLLLLLLCGCAQRTEMTTFQIKTLESTNQGNPFYVLFKATDLPHFLTDDYKKIAHQRMLAEDNPAYLDSVFFLPGETKTISIKNPENKSIGVYCIFTHPGEEWKYIAAEEENSQIKLLLAEDEIKTVSAF
jgi:predicted component of type VI protein secretion system